MAALTITLSTTSCLVGEIVTISYSYDGGEVLDVNFDDGGEDGTFDGEFEGIKSVAGIEFGGGSFDYTAGSEGSATITASVINGFVDSVDYPNGQTIFISGSPVDQPQDATVTLDLNEQDEGYLVNISVDIANNSMGSSFQLTLDDGGTNGAFAWPFDAASGVGSITITAAEGNTYDFTYTIRRPTVTGTLISISVSSDTVNGYYLQPNYPNSNTIIVNNHGRTGAIAATV